MQGDLTKKYIWLIDTLTRYGKLTREDICDLWARSPISEGRALPERTFFHMRRSIEEVFGIEIACTRSGEYYIEQMDSEQGRAYTNWLLDSYAVRSALSDVSEAGEFVMVEEIPSARRFLAPVLEAIRDKRKILFSYAGFSRSRTEKGILFRPYFVRLYKQRWYMVGYKDSVADIRTYALDRVKELAMTDESYDASEAPSPGEFFKETLGVTTTKSDARIVRLRTTPSQAKYFRALPLHESQQEEVGTGYSIFTYRLKLNFELVHELLGLGSEVEVLAPRELQVMVADELRRMLKMYDPQGTGEAAPIVT